MIFFPLHEDSFTEFPFQDIPLQDFLYIPRFIGYFTYRAIYCCLFDFCVTKCSYGNVTEKSSL